ncbi:MAG: type II toxin-antitoxin system VapC family toxin [Candidatus Methylomirabilales bacterium]
MSSAYVDSSSLVAIAFGEPGSAQLVERLERYDELFSSALLEAELRAALAREGVADDAQLLHAISWVLPQRALSPEITRVLSAGYLRGADLWHLACALFLAQTPRDLSFVSVDRRQVRVARALGFGAEP